MRDKIKREAEKVFEKYRNNPIEIVRDYNGEQGLIKDYANRQIYELLQNADDQMSGEGGRVRISFDGKTLAVSNTGEPFSFEGIRALMYANASPKCIRSDKIGCKGLGFRSVLNWSSEVTVASDGFSVRFSKPYAQKCYDQITANLADLHSEIGGLTKERYPISIMACPEILEENALVEGFATSIIIRCRESLSEQILSQIKSLQFEELIFLPNLKEVEVICPGYHKKFFKISEDRDVMIEETDCPTGTKTFAAFRLYSRNGMLTDEHGRKKSYEFIIAYDSSGEHTGDCLYSYFKTDVKLSFPALVHGTFELAINRNSLQKDSKVNRQMISLLADFMAETAIAIAEEQEACNYIPLKLLISGDMDLVMKKDFGFEVELRKRAKDKKILPTIAGGYVSVSDTPRYSEQHFDGLLHAADFAKLLQSTDDPEIRAYLANDLNLCFYPFHEFCRLLHNHIDDYSILQRAEIVARIQHISAYRSEDLVKLNLLIDTDAQRIANDEMIYPYPENEQVIELPAWIRIKFLHPEMEKALYRTMGINTKRNLVNELERYGLAEYSFDKLVRSVIAQMKDMTVSTEHCLEILKWLWNYFLVHGSEPLNDSRIKIICRDGSIYPAGECYIGREFGNLAGEQVVSLFSDRFAAKETLYTLSRDDRQLERFLLWLGASKFPRLISKKLGLQEREAYLEQCYPFISNYGESFDRHEFPLQNVAEVCVGTFEHLDEILSRADFNDILAWFLSDDNVKNRIQLTTEERNPDSCIKGTPYKKQNERTVPNYRMKSWLRFVLSSKKWIPDVSQHKVIPSKCCFEDQLPPYLISPDIRYQALKETLGYECRNPVRSLLQSLGVAEEFHELDKETIYETLLHLKDADPNFEKGKTLFRKLRLRDKSEQLTRENAAYEKFLNQGYVPVRYLGGKQYVPVSEAFYTDKQIYSREILKLFPMLDIDHRYGEVKAKELFGVKSLKDVRTDFEHEPTVHALNAAFQNDYRSFLPFVHILRKETKKANQEFQALKRTDVILCSEICINYEIEGTVRPCTLQDFETVYFRTERKAYIQVSREDISYESLKNNLKFRSAVAEIIAAILDVNEGKETYQSLFGLDSQNRKEYIRIYRGDDDLRVLEESRRSFEAEEDRRLEFWKSVAGTLGLRNNLSVEQIISELGLQPDIDQNVIYERLCDDHAAYLIHLFRYLHIDISDYNSNAYYRLDISAYHLTHFKEKKQQYQNQYFAYIYEKLKDEPDNVQQYAALKREYLFGVLRSENSVNTDADRLFCEQFHVHFAELEAYSSDTFEKLLAARKAQADPEQLAEAAYGLTDIEREAYLLFDRLSAYTKQNGASATETEKMQQLDQSTKENVRDALKSVPSGIVEVRILKKEHSYIERQTSRKKQQPAIHSEVSDAVKQSMGIVSEAKVFAALRDRYSNVQWVSGNAEKAGVIPEGNDTCGYDICYIDQYGDMQYVEVKSGKTKQKEIAFYLSESELRFAEENAEHYEVFFVYIGEDNKPIGNPLRLGHLFCYAEGESFYQNSLFHADVSKKYRISDIQAEIVEP